MTDRIRVLLVDDQELIRLGFRLSLEAADDVEIVGEAADGQEGADLAQRLLPDVVIMDIRMPRLDGIAATARIVAEVPTARVLVVTTFDLDEYAFGALEAGASGFLLKDATSTQLIDAVRSVQRGDAILSPRATRLLIEAHATRAAPPAAAEPTNVTSRERDVLLAVGRGLNNTEIAAELFLSESTVKTHVGRLLTKLDARDRVHLVILAHRSGLVH